MAQVLNLSPEDIRGFVALCELGDAGVRRLSETVSKASVMLKQEELEAVIAADVPTAIAEVAQVLIRSGLAERDHDVDEFHKDVAATLEAKKVAKAERERWEAIAPAFRALITTEPLRVLAKAIHLKYAHATIQTGIEIITDVRPIFDAPRKNVVAAVVSHTLQLNYMLQGEEHTLTLALDDADLDAMVDEADRAKEKARTLREFFKTRVADLRVEIVGTEDGDDGAH